MVPSSKHTGVEPGEFPYALRSVPHETRYLTWVRNHSNYMSASGLPDYARALAVLVRGAIVNALVALPALIVLGVLVALLHVLPQEPGYHITRWVMAGGAVLVLLFPFGALLLRIRGFQRSRFRGSDSTVLERDRWERRFGLALVLVVAAALFEALPAHLADVHFWARGQGWRAPEMAAVTGVLLAMFSMSDRLLAALSGAARKLAVVAVGVVGIALPATVVFLVADYLVFGRIDAAWTGQTRSLTEMLMGADVSMFVSLGLMLSIALVLLVGLVSRAFSWRDGLRVLGWLVLAALLVVVLDQAVEGLRTGQKEKVRQALHDLVWRVSEPNTVALNREWDRLIHDDSIWAPRRDALSVWWEVAWHEGWEGAVDTAGADESAPGALADAGADTMVATAPQARGPAADPSTVETTAAAPGELAPPAEPVARPRSKTWNEAIEILSNRSEVAYSYDAFVLARRLEQLKGLPDDKTALIADVDRISDMIEAFAPAAQTTSRTALLDKLLDERFLGNALESLDFEVPALRAAADPKVDEALSIALGDFWTRFSQLEDLYWEVFVNAMYAPHRYPLSYRELAEARYHSLWLKAGPVLALALLIWLFCWLTVDINQTSIHGLYRDRLATAFLVGADEDGDVDIEQDLDLGELARHEAGSHAPYHLINVALNLQGSGDMGLRDRKSDYFIFSKLFIGGARTGYCRSEAMERVYPQTSLAAAMAISAAAASPNMGRATNPALAVFMTLLNMRLGIWIPNPGRLHQATAPKPAARKDAALGSAPTSGGLDFDTVFREELGQVQRRWQRYAGGAARRLADLDRPSTAHGLVGIGLSGGGIRSATVNLGLLQVLHQRGLFDHADYLSTVSGGGYLGASLSALMRRKTSTESPIAGRALVRRTETGEQEVVITPVVNQGLAAVLEGLHRRWRQAWPGRRRRAASGPSRSTDPVTLRFASYAQLAVADGAAVQAGQRLLSTGANTAPPASFGEQLRWRVRPAALLREMLGKLDDQYDWVNVSDGGHIENLAGIELLRRRCRLIIIGDGEADPMHRFGGLATLMRSARIDLGVAIDIDLEDLRLDAHGLCRAHCAIGRIRYPRRDDADDSPQEEGLLLYIKSSVTGGEDEVIREYRAGSPSFPHESTADQMFCEGQFEAYRSLGQHIGEQVLAELQPRDEAGRPRPAAYEELLDWITRRAKGRPTD